MMIENESQRKVCSTGLSQDTLKKYLDYNPNTGIFTWKLSTNGRTAVGSVAGSEDSKDYKEYQLRNGTSLKRYSKTENYKLRLKRINIKQEIKNIS